tara:strand:+ start:83 stop:448 length:366 start_codon:yes stop_codon:yes gene_type:complete
MEDEREGGLSFLEEVFSLSEEDWNFTRKVWNTYSGLISVFGWDRKGISLYVEYPEGMEGYMEMVYLEGSLRRELADKSIGWDRIGRENNPNLWELYFEKGRVRVYMGSSGEVSDLDDEDVL